jgi:hypothetical protein
MNASGRHDELVGGWGGPLRRWQAMDGRDRVGVSLYQPELVRLFRTWNQ